jgi:diguanylate cyclase (GGDEF)-like protein/PAS domain S-box-containing protein
LPIESSSLRAGAPVAEAQLLALAESAWFGVMLCREARIVYANPPCARLIGLPSENIAGQELARFLDLSNTVEATAEHRKDRGRPIHATLRPVDTPLRHVLATYEQTSDATGPVTVVTLVDVTDNDLTRFALQHRWELEIALTDVSRHLLALHPEEFLAGLRLGIERLGRAVDAARMALLVIPPQQDTRPFVVEWSAAGNSSTVDTITDTSSATAALGRPGEDDMRLQLRTTPPDWLFQNVSADDGVGLTATVRLPRTTGLNGALGWFWPDRESPPGEDEMRVLRVSAEMLTSAIRRHRAESELRRQRERVDLAQKAGRSVSWEWYLGDDRIIISRSATALFGLTDDQIPRTGKDLWAQVDPDDREKVRGRILQSLKERRPYSVEHRVQIPGGGTRWLSVRGLPIDGIDGDVTGLVGVSADITDRKLTEDALRKERERAQVTLDCIGDGVIRTDHDGLVDFMNPAAEHLTGWSARDARGRSIAEVYRAEFDGAGRRRQDPVTECLRTGRVITSSDWCSLVRRDEITFAIRDSAAPLISASGEAFGVVITFTDVSHTLSLEREMAFLAAHDSLTGLMNRHQFEVALGDALAKAKFKGQNHALCFIDLDAFKLVNDSCGHAAGDEMLLQIAGALESRTEPGTVLARLGGDEFGVLYLDLDLDEARDRADHMREALSEVRFVWHDRVFQVGASIGIVPVTQSSDSLEALLAAADAACYVAKERGRNQIHVSCPDDQEVAARHREMRGPPRITSAFAENRFRLYTQVIRPIARDDDPQIVELLLRMVDEEGGIIEPGYFLPAAERYRMMLSVDQWVIHSGLETVARLRADFPDGTIFSLNLSGQSLGDTSLLGLILNEIQRSDLRPETLCFEITETAAISNIAAAQSFIETLADRGCLFALDDFGSGLSSFRYLRHLGVTYLKVDGNLIRDVSVDPIHREMVSAINRIGKTMGLRTIGEWVEDDAALQVLRELGLDYAQGHWIGRPRPAPVP